MLHNSQGTAKLCPSDTVSFGTRAYVTRDKSARSSAGTDAFSFRPIIHLSDTLGRVNAPRSSSIKLDPRISEVNNNETSELLIDIH